ncbi:hypothetical protein NL676_009554 [Syzygium grande]|nr:hypothetical protein NL676_009554 [Syzygium grande]
MTGHAWEALHEHSDIENWERRAPPTTASPPSFKSNHSNALSISESDDHAFSSSSSSSSSPSPTSTPLPSSSSSSSSSPFVHCF